MTKKITALIIIFIAFMNSFIYSADSGSVDLTVSVVGTIFSLELQDANEFPLVGEIDLGRYRPGESDYPMNGVMVAGCKSNTGYQWYLQVEADSLIDRTTSIKMPGNTLKVKGLPVSSASTSDKLELPGTLVKVGQALTTEPAVVYTSSSDGDTGFNEFEGTYITMGFGVDVPKAQPAGTYETTILFTLTE